MGLRFFNEVWSHASRNISSPLAHAYCKKPTRQNSKQYSTFSAKHIVYFFILTSVLFQCHDETINHVPIFVTMGQPEHAEMGFQHCLD